MDIAKKIKLWRAVGKVFDTKIGSSIVEKNRKPLNWMAGAMVSPNRGSIPWTPFHKPLAQSCLALVSTAGFHLDTDEPFDVDSGLGDASFRKIPSDYPKERLKIAHTHYPHARVQKDINVLFPLDRLRELAEAKVLGRLAKEFYSFGFGGNLTKEFIGEPHGSAHKLARELKAHGVDYLLMVPA